MKQFYYICDGFPVRCGGQWYDDTADGQFSELTSNQATERVYPVPSPRYYLVWVVAREEGVADYHYVAPGQTTYCAEIPFVRK